MYYSCVCDGEGVHVGLHVHTHTYTHIHRGTCVHAYTGGPMQSVCAEDRRQDTFQESVLSFYFIETESKDGTVLSMGLVLACSGKASFPKLEMALAWPQHRNVTQ